MNKLILTLAITLVALPSFASGENSSSIVIDSGQNESSFGKGKQIESRTTDDIAIIKNLADKWNQDITDANTKLKESKDQLQTVIDDLKNKNEQYMQSESDSKANAFTKQYVPTCSGSYPRLAYQSGQWRCIAAIDCKKVKSGSVDWEADPVTGKCKRPAAVWKTTNWSGNCNASPYTQTRSVNCYKEGTSTKLSSATCSLPKPATSRECAN
tara:strand:- start:1311 stop:1946 length:636 start_codon:yes stop_codon:yes gene_type:complete